MINQLLIFSVAIFAILSFGLGIFSLIKNPKSKMIMIWFVLSVVIFLWGINFVLVLINNDSKIGIFYNQWLHFWSAFIPILFFHFVLLFLSENFLLKNLILAKIFIIFGYVFSVIFALLSFSKLIVFGVTTKYDFDYWVDLGSLYNFYILNFWFITLLSIIYLAKSYFKADGVIKRKVGFIIIASLLGFCGGITNFLSNVIDFYPIGNFFSWLYPIFIVYGIFIDEFKFRVKF